MSSLRPVLLQDSHSDSSPTDLTQERTNLSKKPSRAKSPPHSEQTTKATSSFFAHLPKPSTPPLTPNSALPRPSTPTPTLSLTLPKAPQKRPTTPTFAFTETGMRPTAKTTPPASLPPQLIPHPIPDTVLAKIFSFLPGVNDLLAASLVNKQWNRVARLDALWKQFADTINNEINLYNSQSTIPIPNTSIAACANNYRAVIREKRKAIDTLNVWKMVAITMTLHPPRAYFDQSSLRNVIFTALQFDRWITLNINDAKFTTIQRLFLCSHKLITLNPAICQLTQLEELYLFQNQLRELPDEIGNLTNLRRLSVFRNQLTTLPKTIGKLTNLWCLNLFDNQITHLPRKFNLLKSLKNLYLHKNKLMSLPEEMANFKMLMLLDISANPTKLMESSSIIKTIKGLKRPVLLFARICIVIR